MKPALPFLFALALGYFTGFGARGLAAALPIGAAFTSTSATNTAPAMAPGPVVMPPVDSSPVVAPATNAVAPTETSATNSPGPVMTPATNAPATPSLPNTAYGLPTAPAGQDDDIEDIRPPLRPPTVVSSWLWITLASLAAAAALVFVLWKFLSKRRMVDPRTAYDLALERLERARALMSEQQPEPYAVEVSEIIRTYLGQRYQAPSTRSTTEEFLRRIERDPHTPFAEHRELLGDFLQSCDLVKFARYQPTLTELEKVQDRAFDFVTATKPVPVEATNGHT